MDFVICFFFTLLFYAVGALLIDVLTSVEDVRQMARVYLPWLIVTPLIAVWSFKLDGIYIGATKTVAMRNTMIISMAVFYVLVYIHTPP